MASVAVGRPTARPVGRDDDIGRVLAELSRPGNVYLTGGVGIGKSIVLRTVRRRLIDLGVEVITISGMEATSVIPLAPLLKLCPAGADQAGPAIIAELYRRSAAHRTVLIVDDAHLLDLATAAIIRQVAGIEASGLVVAVRDGEPVPAPVSSMLADEMATPIALDPLDRASTIELTETLMGPSDARTLQMVWEQSRGNPLYIHELVAAATRNGVGDAELVGWEANAAPLWTSRLQSLLARRIRGLTDDEREALRIVAVGGRIPRDVLITIVDMTTVSELERQGLLLVDDGLVEIGHPLYSTAALATMTEARARGIRSRLADALVAAESDDLLLIVLLRLDAGEAVDGSLLHRALDAARRPHLPLFAERLSRELLTRGDDPGARMALVEALGAQGRWDEAAAEYEAAVASSHAGDTELPERWAFLNFEYRDDLAHHERIIDEVASLVDGRGSEMWEMVNLRHDLFTKNLDSSLVANQRWLEDHPDSPLRAFALVHVTTASSHCGDFTAGLAAFDELGRPDDLDPVERTRMDGVARQCDAWRRGRVATAGLVERSLGHHAVSGDPEREILAESYRGMILNDLTCLVDALPHLRKALTIDRLARRRHSAHLIRAEMARALASTVDGSVEAGTMLRTLDGISPPSMWMVQPVYRLAESLLLLRSDRDPRASIVEGTRCARRRAARVHEVPLLRLLGEIGEASAVDQRLDEIARHMGGGHARLVAREISALAERSPESLDAVADDAWSFGSDGLAADAASLASGIHLERGNLRAALFSQLRSDAVVGDRPQWSYARSTLQRTMSDRECQVTAAVSAGATNRDVAARLFISHRTVESHLRRIFLRYGFDGRDELADFVGRATRPPAAAVSDP